MSNYIEEDDLRQALQQHAEGRSDPLALALYKIADGVLGKHYVHGENRDDYRQDMVLHTLQVAHKHDADNGSVFNFLTTCVQNRLLVCFAAAKRDRRKLERYAAHLEHPNARQEAAPRPTRNPARPHPRQDEIVALRQEGLKLADIGERMGLHASSVYVILRGAGVVYERPKAEGKVKVKPEGKRARKLAEVKEMIARGLTQGEIARERGVTTWAVAHYCRTHGLEASPQRTLEAERERVLAWHADGLSHAEIGRRLGRDATTVCRYIRRWTSWSGQKP